MPANAFTFTFYDKERGAWVPAKPQRWKTFAGARKAMDRWHLAMADKGWKPDCRVERLYAAAGALHFQEASA